MRRWGSAVQRPVLRGSNEFDLCTHDSPSSPWGTAHSHRLTRLGASKFAPRWMSVSTAWISPRRAATVTAVTPFCVLAKHEVKHRTLSDAGRQGGTRAPFGCGRNGSGQRFEEASSTHLVAALEVCPVIQEQVDDGHVPIASCNGEGGVRVLRGARWAREHGAHSWAGDSSRPLGKSSPSRPHRDTAGPTAANLVLGLDVSATAQQRRNARNLALGRGDVHRRHSDLQHGWEEELAEAGRGAFRRCLRNASTRAKPGRNHAHRTPRGQYVPCHGTRGWLRQLPARAPMRACRSAQPGSWPSPRPANARG